MVYELESTVTESSVAAEFAKNFATVSSKKTEPQLCVAEKLTDIGSFSYSAFAAHKRNFAAVQSGKREFSCENCRPCEVFERYIPECKSAADRAAKRKNIGVVFKSSVSDIVNYTGIIAEKAYSRKTEQEKIAIARENKKLEKRYLGDSVIENGVLKKYKGEDSDVIIPESITCIGEEAFYECDYLETVTIPDSVTAIENYAFFYCESLYEIVMSDSVTKIEHHAFCGCENLEYVKMSKNIKRIEEHTFDGCKSLTEFEVPEGVTDIGDSAFWACDNLKSITFPDSLISIGDQAFWRCESLENVDLPNGLKTIGAEAFECCHSIEYIIIPDSVSKIGGSAFAECSELYGIEISPDNEAYCIENNCLIETSTKKVISCCNDGFIEPDMDISCICDSVFKERDDITEAEIPDGVTYIGDDAFKDCENLCEITLPDSITYICENAFKGTGYYDDECNWDDYILYIGNHLICADEEKSGKADIMPGTLTIAESAFEYCEKITGVTIPDSVRHINDYAFYECKKIKKLVIPDGLESIGYRAFRDCEKLADITIPDSVKSIDTGAFYETAYYNNDDNWEDGMLYICRHLIDVSNSKCGNVSIKSDTITISGSAFYECGKITGVTIPNSVVCIGAWAFYGCSNLVSVSIPCSVTEIGRKAFSECEKLKKITYGGTKKQWHNIKSIKRIGIENVTVKCADGDIEL